MKYDLSTKEKIVEAVHVVEDRSNKELEYHGPNYKGYLQGYLQALKDVAEQLVERGNLKVDMGFATLVAEKSWDPVVPEVFVYLQDKDGRDVQSLATVTCAHHVNEEALDEKDEFVLDQGVSIKVFADKDYEDFTHSFEVGFNSSEREMGLDEKIAEAESKCEAYGSGWKVSELGER